MAEDFPVYINGEVVSGRQLRMFQRLEREQAKLDRDILMLQIEIELKAYAQENAEWQRRYGR
jgi:hypothetical protein